jgi:L-amino acid N-acyltransferase YncA
MAITIRPATERDAEAICAVLNPIIAAGTLTVMTEPCDVAGQLAFMRSLGPRSIFLVAIDDASGELVGLQDVQPADGEPALHHVGVVSTFVGLGTQRRGIGRRLFCAMRRRALALGYRKVMATIRADNDAAVAFYRGLGFEHVGVARRHALIGGRYIDEVIAERWINCEDG